PPCGVPGIFVITTNRGLIDAETPITLEELRALSDVEIDHEDERYRRPLERDAREVAARLPPRGDAVLLGSISTSKYIHILEAALGERLKFPIEFVGRGDMSRGGLLLRHAVEGD